MKIMPSLRAVICVALVAATWMLCGCTPNPSTLAEALAQLKDDHATVCIKVIGPWGTALVSRSNAVTANVGPICP